MIINQHLNQSSSESQKTACQGSSSIRSCANSWASHSNISSPAMAPRLPRGFADLTNKGNAGNAQSQLCLHQLKEASHASWLHHDHHDYLILDQVKDDMLQSEAGNMWLCSCDSIFKLAPIAANMYDSICHRCLIYNCIVNEQGKETYGSWLNHQSGKVRATK